jgi:nucleoside-diphosphate-sugar epimerase
MKIFNIGISCIGSGVGQSVINSLKHSRLPIRTIGFGTNPFAFGAYDCDVYDYTTTIYDLGYIDDLIEKCKKHQIDLIIPGLDDEALLFSQNIEKFQESGILPLVGSQELITICRDKERMSLELNKVANVFVRSSSKANIYEDLKLGNISFPLIAKPRGGFASRGIEILLNEHDLDKVTEDHIIQEIAAPASDDPHYASYMKQLSAYKNPQVAEVSIQLVYGPDGNLMGRMASYNKLNNGVPIEIIPYDNPLIWGTIEKVLPYFAELGLKGPLNIQGRLTNEGFKIFEMNPRFTGITGLRALMGFNEVEASVKEWLSIDKGKNNLSLNSKLIGIRQTTDRVIPIEREAKVQEQCDNLHFVPYKSKKVIFITGAFGYLGSALLDDLVRNGGYIIWAYTRDKRSISEKYVNNVECIFDYQDYQRGLIAFGNIDILLHMGFARPDKGNLQIAESVSFSFDLLNRAIQHQVPYIINISSQQVYGAAENAPWLEKTKVVPTSVYGLAKYSVEEYLRNLTKNSPFVKATSLRLATLAGGQFSEHSVDFMSKMINKVYNGETITIVNKDQVIERLDIRDASHALLCILKNVGKISEQVYNVGPGVQRTLSDVVDGIKSLAFDDFGNLDNRIEYSAISETKRNIGMKIDLFSNDFGWVPKFGILDSLASLYFSYHLSK